MNRKNTILQLVGVTMISLALGACGAHEDPSTGTIEESQGAVKPSGRTRPAQPDPATAPEKKEPQPAPREDHPPMPKGPVPYERCAGRAEKGLYEGGLCGEGKFGFIRTENISCKAALENCVLNAENNPSQSVRCEFDGKELYRRELTPGICDKPIVFPPVVLPPPTPGVPPQASPPVPAPEKKEQPQPAAREDHPPLPKGPVPYERCVGRAERGLHEGAFCGDGKFGFIRTENIACKSALENCVLNAENNPRQSVRCDFNGKELYRRELTPGICDKAIVFPPIVLPPPTPGAPAR